MTRFLLCLTIILCAACQPHLVIDPNAAPPVPRMRPHVKPPTVGGQVWPAWLPTVTPEAR